MISYFFVKTALWTRLDCIPAVPLDMDSARLFWRVVEKQLVEHGGYTTFWQRVFLAKAHPKLIMTTIEIPPT